MPRAPRSSRAATARPTIRRPAPIEVADKPVDNSDNARSLVFRFKFGAFDFLDAGDLTWNIEKQLVCPEDLIGPIDLYQVTHHGMDISNHPTLVRSIAPTVAIMNNGPRKGGAAATVQLAEEPARPIEAFYALHKNQATPPEDNADPAFTANHDPAGGQFIQVNVAPDGSGYTVRIGADGEPRKFVSQMTGEAARDSRPPDEPGPHELLEVGVPLANSKLNRLSELPRCRRFQSGRWHDPHRRAGRLAGLHPIPGPGHFCPADRARERMISWDVIQRAWTSWLILGLSSLLVLLSTMTVAFLIMRLRQPRPPLRTDAPAAGYARLLNGARALSRWPLAPTARIIL